MQNRTIWSFVLFVTVYLATTVMLALGSIYATQMRKASTHSHQELLHNSYLVAIADGAESSARAFVLSGDFADLHGLQVAKQKISEELDAMKSLTQDEPEQSRRVAELSPLLTQELDDLFDIVDLKKSEMKKSDLKKTNGAIANATNGAMASAITKIIRHSKLPAVEQSRAILSEITADESESITRRTRKMDRQSKTKLPLIIGSAFLALFLLGIALRKLFAEAKSRARSMQELETSEERHRLTLEAGQMAIWEMNIKTGEGTWGGFAREIYGIDDLEELTNREKSRSFVHEDDRAWVKAHLDEAIRIGFYRDIEFRIVRKDGQIRWVQGWAKMIPSPNGAPEKVIGGVIDITDKRAARETIARHEKSILYASKMAALGEMAGGIAHEINNPLAIISGQAQLCLELMDIGEATPEQMTKSLQKIRQWVGRTATIIQGLRQFSRDGTHDPFHVSRVNEIIEKTFELCRETFNRHGVKLDISIPSSDLQIECRPVQISQVLLNLLQNAMHAVELGVDRWVRVTVESSRNEVTFRVIDSGPGVPIAIRDKIMQPFFTTKETGKGTGLGLSISKGLVEGHRGQIYLEPGTEHTCFVVKLPIYLSPENHVQKNPAQAGQATQDKGPVPSISL
jgi:PAS domain S-box-containing protein